jgi:hypothetical protein
MKMGEVFEKWHSMDTHRELRAKLRQIGGSWPRILQAMNRGQTFEQVFRQKRIIVLSCYEDKDIEMMNERIVDIDASRNELVGWDQASSLATTAMIPSSSSNTTQQPHIATITPTMPRAEFGQFISPSPSSPSPSRA